MLQAAHQMQMDGLQSRLRARTRAGRRLETGIKYWGRSAAVMVPNATLGSNKA